MLSASGEVCVSRACLGFFPSQGFTFFSVLKGLHYEKEVSHLIKQAQDRDKGNTVERRPRAFAGMVLVLQEKHTLTSSKSGPQG